jgi:indole-3-glycerol phosphate synthase
MLDEILAGKRLEIEARARHMSVDAQRDRAAHAPPVRKINLDGKPGLIAEFKRRSPSKGELGSAVDPADHARAYERGGARAISVLTDATYFDGSFEDLAAVRAAVSIPVLCKDFILTSYQVYEARAWGADILLLIVAALNDDRLIELHRLAVELGMLALVEVHDQHDLARAIAIDARLIGINNRDLTDFSVDLLTTEYLAPLVPDVAIIVSESGITTPTDVRRAVAAGAHVVLVGEALMKASDIEGAIRELMS